MTGLLARIEAKAAEVKAAILKGVAEVDGVVIPESEKIEPFIAPLLNQIMPGAGNVANVAEAWLVAGAKLIDTGGAAVKANLANQGFDSALIAQVESIIPTLRAASNSAKG